MLSYSINGSLEAPLVIFLHGLLGTKEDWKEVIHLLEKRFCCLSLDLPGHGSSPLKKNFLAQIETFLLKDVYQERSQKPFALIGYSMGGRIALQFSEKNPSPVCKIIVISSYVGDSSAKERLQQKDRDEQWAKMLEEEDIEAFLKKWYDQPLFDALRENKLLFAETLKRRKRQDPHAIATYFRQFSKASQSPFQLTKHFPSFLYGEEDLKFGALYLTLPASIKRFPVARAGHAVHLENPVACAAIITQILESQDTYGGNHVRS
ncbi:MAG: alpha/beta fold hydrolase [Anaerolineae bacterium]